MTDPTPTPTAAPTPVSEAPTSAPENVPFDTPKPEPTEADFVKIGPYRLPLLPHFLVGEAREFLRYKLNRPLTESEAEGEEGLLRAIRMLHIFVRYRGGKRNVKFEEVGVEVDMLPMPEFERIADIAKAAGGDEDPKDEAEVTEPTTEAETESTPPTPGTPATPIGS